MLLGTFVDEVWWPSCGKLRECTRVGYESAYRCHIQPKWAGVDMESITANDIEEWLGSFNQAGAARKAWPCCGRYSDSPIARESPTMT